jgi:hypothetical protein
MKYFAVMFMFLLVVLFSLGVGPIAWFITSEIFNHGARTLAVSLTVSANWFANFLVGQSFLPLQVKKTRRKKTHSELFLAERSRVLHIYGFCCVGLLLLLLHSLASA